MWATKIGVGINNRGGKKQPGVNDYYTGKGFLGTEGSRSGRTERDRGKLDKKRQRPEKKRGGWGIPDPKRGQSRNLGNNPNQGGGKRLGKSKKKT